jgi:hypothetical protein
MRVTPSCRAWILHRIRLPILLCVAATYSLLPGCAHRHSAMASVPRAWRDANPWGPEGLEARAKGELKPRFYTDQMAEWAAFARGNLQDGDILFRYGYSRCVSDFFENIVVTGTSDTSFTHNGIVFHQGEEVWVYDVEPDPQGVRKIPFEFWMLDTIPGRFAVMRLKEPYRATIPQALTYCEEAWRRQPPFDKGLRLDDDRLYCSEMIEKAFRSAGLALSEPITMPCLPRYEHYRPLRPLVERFTELSFEEPQFNLGNEHFGTYGSPYLELVNGGEKRKHGSAIPPICPPTPFPAKQTFADCVTAP